MVHNNLHSSDELGPINAKGTESTHNPSQISHIDMYTNATFNRILLEPTMMIGRSCHISLIYSVSMLLFQLANNIQCFTFIIFLVFSNILIDFSFLIRILIDPVQSKICTYRSI